LRKQSSDKYPKKIASELAGWQILENYSLASLTSQDCSNKTEHLVIYG